GRSAPLLPDPLPGRRHPGEGGPRLDGSLAGAARTLPGHEGGGVRRAAAVADEDVAHAHQGVAQARAPRRGPRRDPAPAEEGLWNPGGGVDPRAAAAAVRGPALGAHAAGGWPVRARSGARAVAGAPRWPRRSAEASLDALDVPALAEEPRPVRLRPERRVKRGGVEALR